MKIGIQKWIFFHSNFETAFLWNILPILLKNSICQKNGKQIFCMSVGRFRRVNGIFLSDAWQKLAESVWKTNFYQLIVWSLIKFDSSNFKESLLRYYIFWSVPKIIHHKRCSDLSEKINRLAASLEFGILTNSQPPKWKWKIINLFIKKIYCPWSLRLSISRLS